ncbi:MAG: hypothetical protein AAF485_28595 [Chloroflexota bacterium]
MKQQTAIIIIAVWSVCMVSFIAIAYFWMQSSQFREEFDPLIAVCRGERVNVNVSYSSVRGIHPAMGVTQTSSGFSLDTDLILDQALTSALADTQAVLCLGTAEEVYIESCPYGNGRNPDAYIERYYYKQQARLVDAKTQRVIAEQTFTGNSPKHCEEEEWFSEDETVVRLKGSSVDTDDVRGWAATHLIIN